MADGTTGLPVKSLPAESVRARLVDTGGTNEAAISAAGRLSVDASGVTVPVSDAGGSLTVDGSVSITGSIPAGTNNIGDVDVLSVVPGTAATNLGKAVDAAAGASDTGVALLAVRDDVLSALTPADGDYTHLRVNDQGALHVVSTGGATGTEYTEGATDATITGTAIMWEDTADTLRPVSAASPLPTVQIGATPAGNNNIGDVDIVTVPAPLSTTGNGTAATALRVTMASDSTGVVALTGSLPAGNNNIGDVDIATMPNVTLAATTNTIEVVGDAAHDAAAAGNPLLLGAFASAAAPTNVSADGDVVRLWALRSGALATQVTAGGALVGGDATNGLDVDVTRVSGNVSTNIAQIGGAAPSATAFVPVRMTDGTAYYTLMGQTAGTAPYTRITDATNTASVIAAINALKTDFSSVAGAVPSATNPVPVRLTDGSSFYSAVSSGGLTAPTISTQTSANLGAGASTDLDFALIPNGVTGQLDGIDISAAVPLKVEIKTVNSAGTPTTRVVLFTPTHTNIQWRSPHKSYVTQAGAAANARFRATITNRDNSTASDVYATAYWDQV